MNMLQSLTTDDATIKTETDSVGTSFSPLESGLYVLKVILSYITLSAGKAMALNVLFETTNKQQMRAQFWMTSGEKKGCKNFYVKKNSKGVEEKFYLPGFNQANGIALLTCDKGINTLATEKKTINLYDFVQRKEVPTEVDMVMELIDKEVSVGVIKQIVDKTKDDGNGNYLPTSETRVENEVDKLFHTDGRTITEIKAKVKKAVFKDTWLERWQGKVKDKSAAKAGVVTGAPVTTQAGAPGSPAPAADSLFA